MLSYHLSITGTQKGYPMSPAAQNPQLTLDQSGITAYPNGDITGTATDAAGRKYHFVACPDATEIGELETLDVSWVTEDDHPLFVRWATLPAWPNPSAQYRAGAITGLEYCLAVLAQCLVSKGYYVANRQLPIMELADTRRFVLQFICPANERGTDKDRKLMEAFAQAWRQLAFEIRSARLAS
jgi:hypothetical protein